MFLYVYVISNPQEFIFLCSIKQNGIACGINTSSYSDKSVFIVDSYFKTILNTVLSH